MLDLHSSTSKWKNSDLGVEVGYWRPETNAMGVDWWSPCVVKDVCEIWAVGLSTRNVPTDLMIHFPSTLHTNAETTGPK